ncbi:MAG: hypothetical protein PUA49_04355 [Butyrivibrio sp.]|nr:hypothetical protein [Butyrivibrio sp.]
MALTINDVKKNVAYKNLPIAILDERYLRLFKDNEKTPLLKQLEKKLSDLLKRQGQITNDIKGIKKIKSDLMKSIIENVENENMSESKRQKLLNTNQKLVIEAKEKIDRLEQEEMEIPGKIRDANIELLIEAVNICYNRIHQNYKDIQLLGNWINETRMELKKRILIKQDKETKNTEIYNYMHDLLGPEMMEVFDNNK